LYIVIILTIKYHNHVTFEFHIERICQIHSSGIPNKLMEIPEKIQNPSEIMDRANAAQQRGKSDTCPELQRLEGCLASLLDP
jgi:hypothetical protein